METLQLKLRYLIMFQRKNIPIVGNYGKLTFKDLKRLDLYMPANIFLSEKCILYTGERKNDYITISYITKKISVLRMLYHNYIGDIESKDRLVYLCENSGVCCNINHVKIEREQSRRTFERYEPYYELDDFNQD